MTRIVRTAVFALVLLLPVAAFAAQTQYRLQVDGLACPFCAYGIEKQLTRTDGVKDIEIDINAGTVTVTMADGTVFVADFYNDRVQAFDAKGTFLAAFGGKGEGPGQFRHAIAVAVADDGSVFVADFLNNRIEKWRPKR